jgi:hypothetical protein
VPDRKRTTEAPQDRVIEPLPRNAQRFISAWISVSDNARAGNLFQQGVHGESAFKTVTIKLPPST